MGAAAQGVGWLYAARVAQGLATGLALGAAAGTLTELHPRADARQAGRVGAAANPLGLALGPLFGGLLAQYAPAPLLLPYAAYAVLLLPRW